MSSYKGEEHKKTLKVDGENVTYYSIRDLEKAHPEIKTLPISLRIILESMIRNFDGKNITTKDVEAIINWNAQQPEETEMSFKVSRVLMQDFTGVPAVVDLASMRDAVKKLGKNPDSIHHGCMGICSYKSVRICHFFLFTVYRNDAGKIFQVNLVNNPN